MGRNKLEEDKKERKKEVWNSRNKKGRKKRVIGKRMGSARD